MRNALLDNEGAKFHDGELGPDPRFKFHGRVLPNVSHEQKTVVEAALIKAGCGGAWSESNSGWVFALGQAVDAVKAQTALDALDD